MVESAVADVIACTVSADNPLAACRYVLLEGENALAGLAAASLHHRNELIADLPCYGIVSSVLEPLGKQRLHLIAAAIAAETLGHKPGDGVAHTLASEMHTETKFAEVLEERILPCRSASLCVGAVR